MTLESLIQTHGYWVVFLGTLLEGETILLLSGVAVQRGYLDPVGVVVAALAGAIVGDNLFFHLGRHIGPAVLERWPHWRERVEAADAVLTRHRNVVIAGFRFLYGLRIATPIALGMSRVGRLRFALLDGAGAIVWSIGVTAAGYGLGSAAARLFGTVHRYELAFLALAVAGAIGLHTAVVLRARRRERASASASSNPPSSTR